MRRHSLVPGVTIAACVAAAACLVLFTPANETCPPGYRLDDELPGMCVSDKHPEPPFEPLWRQRQLMAQRSAPFAHVMPGAYGAAISQREQMKKDPKVKGVG